MAELRYHPLACPDWEVRAFLDNTKTQFRRVTKPQPGPDVTELIYVGSGLSGEGRYYNDDWMSVGQADETQFWYCPYGQPGDRLWVQEAFCPDWGDAGPVYRADGGSAVELGYSSEPKWKPSTNMPRSASRLPLEVVGMRVERAKRITEQDIKANGLTDWDMARNCGWFNAYQQFWDSTHAKRGPAFCFGANPLVWVGEVRRLTDG